jgi:hypothetical protein
MEFAEEKSRHPSVPNFTVSLSRTHLPTTRTMSTLPTVFRTPTQI